MNPFENAKPMERITAYTHSDADGIKIDIIGLARDLIIVAKLNHDSFTSLCENLKQLWDETSVSSGDLQ